MNAKDILPNVLLARTFPLFFLPFITLVSYPHLEGEGRVGERGARGKKETRRKVIILSYTHKHPRSKTYK
mgnify:CR=1 FL=1